MAARAVQPGVGANPLENGDNPQLLPVDPVDGVQEAARAALEEFQHDWVDIEGLNPLEGRVDPLAEEEGVPPPIPQVHEQLIPGAPLMPNFPPFPFLPQGQLIEVVVPELPLFLPAAEAQPQQAQQVEVREPEPQPQMRPVAVAAPQQQPEIQPRVEPQRQQQAQQVEVGEPAPQPQIRPVPIAAPQQPPQVQPAAAAHPPAVELSLFQKIWNAFVSAMQSFIELIASCLFCMPRATAVPPPPAVQPPVPQPPPQHAEEGAPIAQPAPNQPPRNEGAPPVPPQVIGEAPIAQPAPQPPRDEQVVAPAPEPIQVMPAGQPAVLPEGRMQGTSHLHPEAGIVFSDYCAREFLNVVWPLIRSNTLVREQIPQIIDGSLRNGVAKLQAQEAAADERNDFQNIERVDLNRLGEVQDYNQQMRILDQHAVRNPLHMTSVILAKGDHFHVLLIDTSQRPRVDYYHFNPQAIPAYVQICTTMQAMVDHLNEAIPVEVGIPFTMQAYRVR